MDIEKIWEEADWVSHARKIIDNLELFPKNSRIILILRHSHRNQPLPHENVNKLRLTPQGHAIAEKFGENLPKSRTIKLYYSKIWRCEETAENIHKGFQNIGGRSELIGEYKPLFDIGIQKRSFTERFKKRHFREVLYRWAAGFYPIEEWIPFTTYCQETAHYCTNCSNC